MISKAYTEGVQSCRDCREDNIIPAPRYGTGPLNPGLMIVGQNPPVDPARSKHGAWLLHYPNVEKGPHELLVHELIRELGFENKHVWATQAVKCPTLDNDRPSRFCVTRCSTRWLRHEISILGPKIILALGELAHVGVMSALMTNPTMGSRLEIRYCVPVGASMECEVKRWTTHEGMRIIHAPHPSKVGRFLDRDSWINNIKWGMEGI